MSDALAGLRPIGGELAVLAVADDRAASRLDDPAPDSAFLGADGAAVELMTLPTDRAEVGQEHFVRFAEIGEVDALVTDDELADGTAREIEAAGVEVMRV